MARCGRCGLYNKYPQDHKEQKWSGVCLWYQHRLQESDEYEKRECSDFFEKIPEVEPLKHFDYKIRRDNLRDAYVIAKRSKVLAFISLGISITGVILKLIL